MATTQSFIDYIIDQLSLGSDILVRKMFGEYAIYCQKKVVALVCDNTVYIKITDEGKRFAREKYKEWFPYPGAKAWMQICDEDVEDGQWLAELVSITADQLPLPAPKKSKLQKKSFL